MTASSLLDVNSERCRYLRLSIQIPSLSPSSLLVPSLSPNPTPNRRPLLGSVTATFWIIVCSHHSTPYSLYFLATTPSIHTKNHTSHDDLANFWQPYNLSSIVSTSRSPASYLNTPISAVSTTPLHSTHPITHHTHLSPDVIQCKPYQVVCLVGKPHAVFNLSSFTRRVPLNSISLGINFFGMEI